MKSLNELKVGDKFKFAPGQVVSCLTYFGYSQFTAKKLLGSGTKGEVLKANPGSVRILLKFRDKDAKSEKVSLRFDTNKKVKVIPS